MVKKLMNNWGYTYCETYCFLMMFIFDKDAEYANNNSPMYGSNALRKSNDGINCKFIASFII